MCIKNYIVWRDHVFFEEIFFYPNQDFKRKSLFFLLQSFVFQVCFWTFLKISFAHHMAVLRKNFLWRKHSLFRDIILPFFYSNWDFKRSSSTFGYIKEFFFKSDLNMLNKYLLRIFELFQEKNLPPAAHTNDFWGKICHILTRIKISNVGFLLLSHFKDFFPNMNLGKRTTEFSWLGARKYTYQFWQQSFNIRETGKLGKRRCSLGGVGKKLLLGNPPKNTFTIFHGNQTYFRYGERGYNNVRVNQEK